MCLNQLVTLFIFILLSHYTSTRFEIASCPGCPGGNSVYMHKMVRVVRFKVCTHCNVTVYRNTLPLQCGRDSWPRNVSKVGYAVMLQACSVRCQYWPSHQRDHTVTAWAGLNVQRDTSPPSAPLAFYTSMMLLAPVTNWEPHGVTLAGYCYAMKHGLKIQIVTPYRVGHLQRYGVTVRGNVTSAYPPVVDRQSTKTYSTYQLLFIHIVTARWYNKVDAWWQNKLKINSASSWFHHLHMSSCTVNETCKNWENTCDRYGSQSSKLSSSKHRGSFPRQVLELARLIPMYRVIHKSLRDVRPVR
jgi:hypothetical protein